MPKLFMSEREIEKLLSLAKPNLRDFCLLHLALSTGLRASDLLCLTVDQVIDGDGEPVRFIRLKMRKTGEYVERPLREDCRASITRYLSYRGESGIYLFLAYSNNSMRVDRRMNRTSLRRIYRRYLEQMYPASRLQGNACHVTRRSVAKIISDRAGRIEPASRFLGHRSVEATAAYIDMDGYGRQADEIVSKLSW